MESQIDNKHHVAWADRVGLNKRWAKDIDRVSDCYGTEYYELAVWGFYHDIINIRKGPQLKEDVDLYIRTTWNGKKKDKLQRFMNTYEGQDQGAVDSEKHLIEIELLPDLANFMIQLLEDKGFVFYESTIEEDEMK